MKRRLAMLALAGALSAPAASEAQQPTPFRLELAYDGVLLVKVLDMQIEQTVSEETFSASARMKSFGVLSLFKRLDVRAESRGRVEGGAVRPARFKHANLDGSANRTVEVRWSATDVSATASPAYPSLGDPAPTSPQKLSAADPLTQMTRLALTSASARPCTGGARLFDGRQLYALEFFAASTRELTARERAINLTSPVICNLSFTEVAGFDAKPPHKRNQGLKGPLKILFARVGAGGPWVISAVKGRTPLGEATIELRSVRTNASAVRQSSVPAVQRVSG